MRPRLVIAACAGLALLSACGSGEPGLAPTASAPMVTATATSPPTWLGPDVLSADEVPATGRAAYLDGLTDIDPALTVNEDRAIRRATDICLDIEQGKDEATVISNTVYRLSGGNATIDEAQAADAVQLARIHICR